MPRTRSLAIVAPIVAALISSLAAGTAAIAGDAPFSATTGALCRAPIAAMETRHRIPRMMLSALSLAESGRWHEGERESFAWPWAVTSGTDTWHFDAKEDAVAQVRALKARGVRNIDVGCMQVNLRYHPDAFASIEAAFDPATNVAYAARYLMSLNQATRSWSQAIGRYHSATPERGLAYRRKVEKLWTSERRRYAAVRRAEIIAEFERRQAERDARLAESRRRQGRSSPPA